MLAVSVAYFGGFQLLQTNDLVLLKVTEHKVTSPFRVQHFKLVRQGGNFSQRLKLSLIYCFKEALSGRGWKMVGWLVSTH